MKKQKSTMAIIHAKNTPDEVIVPGEYASIDFPKGGGLSALSSKLLIAVLDHAGRDLLQDKEHRVRFADLNWSHRDKAEIAEAIRELQRTIVEITISTGRGNKRKSGQVLADVERDEDDSGGLVYEFSKTFRQVLGRSTHWASISARAVYAMEGKYSIWLYLLASLYARRTKQAPPEFELSELRQRLGATAPSLKRWPDFRRYVLEPAVAEVNHLTGIRIDWTPLKAGRRVVGIRMAVTVKQGEDIEAAASELDRPRVGRTARRKGLVERIAEERAELRRKLIEELERVHPPTWENAGDRGGQPSKESG